MSNGLQVDQAALAQLLHGASGPVVQYVTKTVRRGNNLAKLEAPVDTGNLRARHQYTVTVNGTEIVGRFGSDADYAAAVHNGHEKTSTVRSGGSSATITRTVRGNPWLKRAARRAGISI